MLNSDLIIVFKIYLPESVDSFSVNLTRWYSEFRPCGQTAAHVMPIGSRKFSHHHHPTDHRAPLPVQNVPPSTTSHPPATSSLSSMSIPSPSPSSQCHEFRIKFTIF